MLFHVCFIKYNSIAGIFRCTETYMKTGLNKTKEQSGHAARGNQVKDSFMFCDRAWKACRETTSWALLHSVCKVVE